ncbi:XRE family transcriptional regulator [Mycobacterium sp. SMC-16]|uniref:XRE family transcriptional regulator n=1 Tax=Mycobacterium sp. SMC-16 TaxID=3385967 RepID=UPI00390C59F2
MSEPQKKNPLGATGKAVADNIKLLRGDMQYVKLAAQLEVLGRPIPTLGLRKIESYERRVDADDLAALAVALGVSPASLLMPNLAEVAKDDLVPITGWHKEITATVVWRWLSAAAPLVYGEDAYFMARGLPSWEREERMRPIMFPGESLGDGDH